MRLPIRSILALSVLVVVLAACGTTVATEPASSLPASTPSADPTTAPSETPSQAPSETPDASRDVAGTITFEDGVAVGGPGGSIAYALASELTQPVLVNGVFFKDTDGTLYLADSLTDANAPSFGGPMLEVVDYPDSAEQWDLANADLTGLREANGILFFENAQLFGFVE